jgi:hypothetical protein
MPKREGPRSPTNPATHTGCAAKALPERAPKDQRQPVLGEAHVLLPPA